MTHTPTSSAFRQNARDALVDQNLQAALQAGGSAFVTKRSAAAGGVPEFEELRDAARDLKNHTLANLDLYLAHYEQQVTEAGGHVHWAETAEDARSIVMDLCRSVDAKIANKGKTMISEEIGLNDHLEENGIKPFETDLGEYIIQLRGETPSHIIAPAIHVTVDQVREAFREHHTHLDPDRNLDDPEVLMAEARAVLREKYFEAEVGITGANMLIAETGQSVLVTNEGNGDLSQSLARVH
ncbi:MAG: LUD domain-containing protein, partial [Pikeienuella sp.]